MQPHVMTQQQLDVWVQQLSHLLESYPAIGSLITMMALDWLSGLMVAIGTKSVSSSIAWRGMCKKVITLVLVGGAAVLSPFANGLPLSSMVATCFIFAEMLSIMENAGKLGVPLPQILTDTLSKLRTDANGKATGLTVVNVLPSVPVEDQRARTKALTDNTKATEDNTLATENKQP